MSEIIEVKVPDLGDFKEIPVIEVLVHPGDAIKAEDPLVTLESDKATMEVPAPASGIVKEVKIKIGDKVSEGAVVLLLDATEATTTESAPAVPSVAPAPQVEKTPPATAPAPAPAVQEAPTGGERRPPPSLPPIDESAFEAAHASPAVRRMARELGVDLGRVTGSGPKSRILKEDVQAYVRGVLSRTQSGTAQGTITGLGLLPWPQVDFAKFGSVETVALSRIKKLSGANLARNWVMIPHVTQHDEADVTDMEAFRKAQSEAVGKQGVRLTPLAFIMKAVVSALKAFPEFNASLAADGESLVLKKYFHLGVAVDTPDGLVVPVIRDVDGKGIVQLARELGEISAKARERKLSPADMQGGSFSISSLGGIGGTAFTPIINAPEVAILGVSKAVLRPVYIDGKFEPRLMLPLSLSYDHRVIDGAQGARFITHLNGVLSDIRRMVL